jgi:mono/diheme cytochrome c family protein
MRRAARVALATIALTAGVGEATGAGLQDFAAVERGRYLAAASDCGSCHTVPGSDHPFSGGRPIETPFGTLVAPNITPDRDTGIGAWSDEEFDTAVRKGIRRDGKRLYPAMPFPHFTRMTQQDVKDIRAYLETVEPVHNPVAVNQLPFPLNQRLVMKVWDKLYFTPGEFMERLDKSKAWNRGAYLVQGPGHCGACHTPKTILGGNKTDKALQGYTLQGWVAPDITSGQGPLAQWSVDDLAQYLKTGHNRFAAAAGLMGEVVDLSTSKLSDDDIKAMAVYLKDQSGPKPTADKSADSKVIAAGGAIYQDLCSACHRSDGTGVPNLIPNLAKAATVNTGDPTTVLRVILQGAQSVATDREPTGPAMPAFGWQLNDAQVAAVATYIRSHWGSAPPVGEDEARKERAQLEARTN